MAMDRGLDLVGAPLHMSNAACPEKGLDVPDASADGEVFKKGNKFIASHQIGNARLFIQQGHPPSISSPPPQAGNSRVTMDVSPSRCDS